jgi:8-oxo-dGTP pyrophosphatase MutT (NUDIX family)
MDGCCSMVMKPYDTIHTSYDFRHKFKKCKAGIFFYDPATEKILLVQSRGMKWGPPKGTLEENETIEECAIREVKEETGICISQSGLSTSHKIDKATYFYIEMKSGTSSDFLFTNTTPDNDASGITWINIHCLEELCNNKKIELNSHCRKLVKKILRINLTKK